MELRRRGGLVIRAVYSGGKLNSAPGQWDDQFWPKPDGRIVDDEHRPYAGPVLRSISACPVSKNNAGNQNPDDWTR